MKSPVLFKKAISFLYSAPDYEKAVPPKYSGKSYDLDRLRRLLDRLGNPELKMRSVLIAGTKGKGSTAAIAASILSAAGYRTGLYTSPHLVSVRERIQVNGRPIDEADFARIVLEIQSVLGKKDVADYQTVFEILTAAAFLCFERKQVDIAVVEAGVGGRLDATNVLAPLVSVITPISIDHGDLLGSTLRKIAREKGGIIKDRGVTVIADQPVSARKELVRIARGKKSVLCDAAKSFTVNNLEMSQKGSVFDAVGMGKRYARMQLSLAGGHQVSNARTALAVIHELCGRCGFDIPDKAIREGMRTVRWPGRLEIVRKHPLVVLDGAHNVASARVLKKSLKDLFVFKNLILVLGISANKDIAGIVKVLAPNASRAIVTRAESVRGADPAVIAALCRKYVPEVVVRAEPKEALATALAGAGKDDLVCVTGSLYLVGAVMKIAGHIVGR